MANRMFNQFQGSLEKGVVQLFAEVSFGATGLPSIVRAKGISAVGKSDTGSFSFTLQDTYNALLGISVIQQVVGNVVPVAPFVTNSVNTNVVSDGIVYLRAFNTAGAAADPVVNTKWYVTITLSNSTAL